MANEDTPAPLPSDSLVIPPDLAAQFRDAVWGAQQLKNIPILRAFTDNDLRKLYGVGEIRSFRPKSYAVIEGEPTRGLFVIFRGTVSVYKNDVITGNMSRLTFLEQGSHFGELSLFDDTPRSASVSAETVCHMFHLDAGDFDKFLQQAGDGAKVNFYKRCSEELCGRFRKLNGDYIAAQQMLWKHALRRDGAPEKESNK